MTPRDATRADLPKGREAQCPVCWRIFKSDWACERHKPYRRPITRECKDPATLGMEPLERRGLAIWTQPAAEFASKLRPSSSGGNL